MGSITDADAHSIEELVQQHPSIKLYSAADEEYHAVRQCFVNNPARPSAIVRPQKAEDVQEIVKFSVQNGVDFSIRGGGHDCAGRSQIDGVLSVDVRDINYVRVDESKTTARIGGGVLIGPLTKALEEHGLVTACGTIATVGYAGWATLGGYGPFSSQYGLGVDQIIGAKVVNAQGEIVDAGEELLKGIRGGGGIFGVIVELTIKVYPLKELLFSMIVFESSNLEATMVSYTEGYEQLAAKGGLAKSLQIQHVVMELPQLGKTFAALCTWADADHDEGRRLFDIVASLGNCITNQPQPTTLHQFTRDNEKVVAYPSYGRVYTTSIKRFTRRTAEILAKYGALLPDGGTAISIHTLRSPSPNEDSVFGSRSNHHMIEIMATTGEQSYQEKAAIWGSALQKELIAMDPENILDGSYVSLLGQDDTDFKKVYGAHYGTLLDLKKKCDPGNVFKYAIPRLPV